MIFTLVTDPRVLDRARTMSPEIRRAIGARLMELCETRYPQGFVALRAQGLCRVTAHEYRILYQVDGPGCVVRVIDVTPVADAY